MKMKLPFLNHTAQRDLRKPAPSSIPKLESLQVAMQYKGARMGGDFFDFIEVEPSRLIFLMMDIAGRRDEAMHIAAVDPRFVSRDDVAQVDIDREREVFLAQPAMTGKPEKVVEQILKGKLDKFYEEFCLLDQPFIKEASQTIGQLIASKVAKLGENISVRRFARFKVGAPDWTVAQTKAAGTEEASS